MGKFGSPIKNEVTLKTEWELRLYGLDGELKDYRKAGNIIVTEGKDYACQALGKYTGQPGGVQFLAVGTGAGAPAAGDVALAAEVGTRVKGTFTNPAGSAYFRNVGKFGTNNPSASFGVTEAALLGTSGSAGEQRGTMLNHSTFAVINKGTQDTLEVTTKVTVS